MMQDTKEKTDLASLADCYGITLELTERPKGEIREDQWACVTFQVEILRDSKVIWSGRYSQGIGCFDVKEVIRYARRWGHYAWANGLKRHGLSGRFKDKLGLVRLLAAFASGNKKKPRVDDVLYACFLDGQPDFDCQSFEDFAFEMGYDTDSIKARKIYDECLSTGRQFRAAFDHQELEKLREAAHEH